MRILIYTDGAATGNPGKGGFGIVMKIENHTYEKEFSEGFRYTTNNRMELMAVIVALQKITKPKQQVVIYSDSKYVVDAINKKWILNWQKKGFNKIKNPDLWQQLLSILPKHSVEFVWIKGHNGHIYNERADVLAVQAYKQEQLRIDSFYEKYAENN